MTRYRLGEQLGQGVLATVYTGSRCLADGTEQPVPNDGAQEPAPPPVPPVEQARAAPVRLTHGSEVISSRSRAPSTFDFFVKEARK